MAEIRKEVTGAVSQSNSNSRPSKDIFGRRGTSTSTQTQTQNTREWRLKYKCKSGGAPSEKASPPTEATPAPEKKGAIKEIVIRF